MGYSDCHPIFLTNGIKVNMIFWTPTYPSSILRPSISGFAITASTSTTLSKKNPLMFVNPREFIEYCNQERCHKCKKNLSKATPDTRWSKYSYEEIIERLKDKSLADLDNLQNSDVLAVEIVENLESALDGFRAIIEKLKKYNSRNV